MINTENSNSLYVFFDESQLRNNKLWIMGAVSVESLFYESGEVTELTHALRKGDMKLHFTDYRESSYDNYSKALKIFLSKMYYVNFNVITFDKKFYAHHPLISSSYNNLINEKIPERVIYGSIRDRSKLYKENIKIFIEESSEYKQLELDKKLKRQLNAQSLYRNDNFKVHKAGLYPKGKEIGIEMCDMLIGILGIIINNATMFKEDGSINKTLLSKKKFIYEHLEILKPFFLEMKYFELVGQNQITKRVFASYINKFQLFYEIEVNKMN